MTHHPHHDPDPHGKRVLTYSTRAVDLDGNVLLEESADTVTFRRAGVVRSVRREDVAAIVDAEHVEYFDVDTAKARAALKAQEAREREAREREDAWAEHRLRRERAVILREHGTRGEAERRPYEALVARGVAREIRERVFVLTAPEGDFVPVSPEDAETRLWVDGDPVMPPGTHWLLGWRGLSPVVTKFTGMGGEALVATVSGRWAVPDAGTRTEWADRPAIGAQEAGSRLLRRLERGATLTARSSEELAALARLASEGVARELEPRVFVGVL